MSRGVIDPSDAAGLARVMAASRAEGLRDIGWVTTPEAGERCRAEGGCFAAALALSQATGWPVRHGVVCDDHGVYVAAGPRYWHAFAPHHEDYRDRPAEEYTRDELEWLGDEAEDMFGSHAWVEAPDGTVLDPTADQFGGPVGSLVARPGTTARRRYWAFPSWCD